MVRPVVPLDGLQMTAPGVVHVDSSVVVPGTTGWLTSTKALAISPRESLGFAVLRGQKPRDGVLSPLCPTVQSQFA